jgi:hypothetical protein
VYDVRTKFLKRFKNYYEVYSRGHLAIIMLRVLMKEGKYNFIYIYIYEGESNENIKIFSQLVYCK